MTGKVSPLGMYRGLSKGIVFANSEISETLLLTHTEGERTKSTNFLFYFRIMSITCMCYFLLFHADQKLCTAAYRYVLN